VNDVRPSRRLSAVGSDTLLMSFFAAAMGRLSKLAIRRASASTKPSSSLSGSARLTYPYRSAVSPSKSFETEHDFERGGLGRRAVEGARAAAAGMHSRADFTCARAVFSREANRMSQARRNSLDTPRARPRIFAMLTTGDFGETNERIEQRREAGGPDGLKQGEGSRRVFYFEWAR